MPAGIVDAFLFLMIAAAAIFSALAWLVLFVSSVITDTGPQARNYPFAGRISIAAGIVSAIGWMTLYEWMRNERGQLREGTMMGSVSIVAVLLAIAMILLGLRLARLRRLKAA